LGHLIVLDTAQFDTPRVFASILLLSISGVALFLIVSLIERIALPWRHGKQAPDYLSLFLPWRHVHASRTAATIPKKEV
jgi:ABC-type transport system involved in cytochrome c biogenesis permease subunit